MVRRILIFAAWLFCTFDLSARSQTDSVRVYFRRGYSVLEPSLRDNRKNLDDFLATLQSLQADSSVHRFHLHLKGSASPDGTYRANQRLSERRTRAVLDFLRGEAQLPDSLISVSAVGIDWEALARWVETHPECPARREVLDILYNTPLLVRDEAGHIVDGRTKQLMDLQGGIPYNYMLERYFPEMRNATITLYREPDRGGADTVSGEGECPASGSDASGSDACGAADAGDVRPGTGAVSEEGAAATGLADAAGADTPAGQPAEAQSGETVADAAPDATSASLSEAAAEPLHRLAIKTNLLYDAILMPSLEVEYRIDDRWSVAVEGDVAWWKRDRAHKYYQIATILPEGRYWFSTKKPWHGHYVGLFAGGSWYDLENGGRGYKGEFWTAGVSYGYMFPIGRSWSLEAGLGVGFLRTRYEEYLPIDGHYVYQQTSRTNWFGPVKVKFALVYRLWDINRKGGRK